MKSTRRKVPARAAKDDGHKGNILLDLMMVADANPRADALLEAAGEMLRRLARMANDQWAGRTRVIGTPRTLEHPLGTGPAADRLWERLTCRSSAAPNRARRGRKPVAA